MCYFQFYLLMIVMCLSGKNTSYLADIMNEELKKIIIWLSANKLSLNIQKTHFIIFSHNKRKTELDIPIFVNNDVITRVYSTKFLGVIIDSQLKWSEHIQYRYVKCKISKGIGIISKARKVFQKSTLVTLYYSFIYPYLSYCIEVWGTAGVSHLSSLLKLQKRVVRINTFSAYRAHTHDLYIKLLGLRV